MSQQAQNDFYESDPGELALDYAAAVNEEVKDLVRRGRRRRAARRALHAGASRAARELRRRRARARASTAWTGTTAVHICFGYAAIIHERPSGYSFLPELAARPCDQISIETAQSGLDLAVLDTLPGKTIILGVLDLDSQDGRVARDRGGAHPPRAAAQVPAELIAAPDCGMKYLPRDVAFGKLESLAAGAAQVRAEEGG